jgi:hypothetical protein
MLVGVISAGIVDTASVSKRRGVLLGARAPAMSAKRNSQYHLCEADGL